VRVKESYHVHMGYTLNVTHAPRTRDHPTASAMSPLSLWCVTYTDESCHVYDKSCHRCGCIIDMRMHHSDMRMHHIAPVSQPGCKDES